MRFLVTLLVTVSLLASPAVAQQEDITALASTTVFFYSASPLGTGSIISATTLGATVNAELEAEIKAATFVELRLHNRGWIFEVAKPAAQGQMVADTQVKVNGGVSTLRTVAVDLEAALSGRRNLALFTNGLRGTIVAIVPLGASATFSGMSLSATGATHVEVLLSGHSRNYRIVSLGTSLSLVMVTAITAESGAEKDQATSVVENLAEILEDML